MTINSVGGAIFDELFLAKLRSVVVNKFTNAIQGNFIAAFGRKVNLAVVCLPKHYLKTPFIHDMLTRQGNDSVENRVPTDDTITQPVVRYVRGQSDNVTNSNSRMWPGE